MKQFSRFLMQYKLFSAVVVTLFAGLILQFTHQITAEHWLLGTVALLATLPLLHDMLQDVRSGKYGIDILAATAIITAVILGQYWAAIVVVLMLTGGESLEDYAEHRAKSELDALLSFAPQHAHVIRNRKTVDVRVTGLRVGDKILIKPGEVVPADAVILEGIASFDESSLTGESLPVAKQINDSIMSGSINSDGAITARVSASAEDSHYQQIIKLVRGASASQAPFVRLADRYSVPFTVTAYAIAVAVWVISGHAIRFLEVIVVATPCPLLLAAPIALISGMSRASRYGIIVKTGSALEKLAEAQTIAFDKTGTLTRGQLAVDNIITHGSHTKDEILALAASLEQGSTHVLAHAIVQAATYSKLRITNAKHVQESVGLGLRAMVKGQEVLVGRLRFIEQHNVILPPKYQQKDIKQTAVYVVVASKLVGIILLKDELRTESKATVDQIRSFGIKDTMIVTGDNNVTAKLVAAQVGIKEVFAEMLPADKLYALMQVTKRPLVFVGDGVNDAPVLTSADVGIALGARGSTAASESADIVIMTDDISRVATAISIAQRTFHVAQQSIFIGIGLSIVLMLLFATGKFSPLLGAVLQEVVDVVVIFNALRAHTGKI